MILTKKKKCERPIVRVELQLIELAEWMAHAHKTIQFNSGQRDEVTMSHIECVQNNNNNAINELG